MNHDIKNWKTISEDNTVIIINLNKIEIELAKLRDNDVQGEEGGKVGNKIGEDGKRGDIGDEINRLRVSKLL